MAIQMRRGSYADFNGGSNLVDGEFGIVTSGDPNTLDGSGVYVDTGANVHRLLVENDTAMNAAIEAALSAYSEGDYPDMQVGGLFSDEYIVDTAPYIFRPTAGGKKVGNRERDKLIGGTVAWNQLLNKANFPATTTINGVTFTNNGDGSISVSGEASAQARYSIPVLIVPNGHKVILTGCPAGGSHSLSSGYNLLDNLQSSNKYDEGNGVIYEITNSGNRAQIHINVASGTNIPTAIKFVPQYTDLTAMFNPTIADYVYSLEQATAGSGIAWLKKYDLIDDQYHAFSDPTLQSVETSAHVTVGFNQFDAETLMPSTGFTQQSDGSWYVSTPNTVYDKLLWKNRLNYTGQICITFEAKYLNSGLSAGARPRVFYTNGSSSPINPDVSTSFVKTTFVSNPSRIVDYIAWDYGSNANASWIKDICINLHWDGERDGEYEAYKKRTYAHSPVVLRGMLDKDENNDLVFNGDEYLPDGTVNRRFREYTFTGEESWSFNSTSQFFGAVTGTAQANYWETINGLFTSNGIKIWVGNNNQIRVYLSANPQLSSSSDLNTVLPSGTKVLYKLATPTTESADPFTELQVVDPDGTEEYIDYGVAQGTRDFAVPVGHYTEYIPDLSANTINDRITALEDGTYTPDNPTATANVTSGKYFMVGSVLYKATASIAAGDKIVVGTNCTKPSIADALNSLS